MESLPDEILEHILFHVIDASEVAACNCVSKRWKDSTSSIKTLYFSHDCFENLPTGGESSESIVERMISRVVQLEKLIVYSPFSAAGLASWLSIVSHSLRHLELRMDNVAGDQSFHENQSKLDCIGVARNLESLKLWGVLMMLSPKWDVFQSLKNLEIVDVQLEDAMLNSMLQSCPFITKLILLSCKGVQSISIDLAYLQECKLDIYGMGNCSLSLISPVIESLEVQGCSLIRVPQTKHLRNLSISIKAGRVYMVDFGNLSALKFLTMRGICWCWEAIYKMLKLASEVTHLYMKVEFTGDFEDLRPFPELDLVDFFNSHQKLQKFDIHGAMFAALRQRYCVRYLQSRFVIPCLEEVVITVRSPLNATRKMGTLDCLLKYSKNLRIMVIRPAPMMKSIQSNADEFFEKICCFAYKNQSIVRIEL
ncbi:hypothetical protein RIF29_42198 [Crotalaria pallida]|uniref:F-box domain-containing protein n=1 Tax=Crotalaria pallida TaxID=3830 RepID=A0AAN9E8P8_CROPI